MTCSSYSVPFTMHTSHTLLALALINVVSSTLTPDNTCGGKNGYTCDPKLARGGPCCSTSGYCGSTAAYCGTGCESAFGTCWSEESSSVSASMTKTKTKTQTKNTSKTKTKNQISGAPTKVSSFTTSTTSSAAGPSATTCGHTISNVGTFTNFANYTFLSSSLPAGLYASSFQVGKPPYTHLFQPKNVVLSPPYLHLIVPGGQTSFPISSAELTTTASNILYASVRTTAILSTVPGTCISSFFYKSDHQEIDIEFITNSSALANDISTLPPAQKKEYRKWTDAEKARLPLHYTNQPLKKGGAETFSWGPGAVDVDVMEHEYRIDWTQGRVEFFLDGVSQQVFTSNVPTKAGNWIWNNWA